MYKFKEYQKKTKLHNFSEGIVLAQYIKLENTRNTKQNKI